MVKNNRSATKKIDLTKILFSLLVVALVFSLAACGKEENPEKAVEFNLDVRALGHKLLEDIEYRDQLEELEAEVFFTLFGIDGEDVQEQINFFGSGATAEEIVVIKAKDEVAAQGLNKIFQSRLKDQAEIYSSYGPAEVPFIEQGIIEMKREYLVYCVVSDASKAKSIIKEVLD